MTAKHGNHSELIMTVIILVKSGRSGGNEHPSVAYQTEIACCAALKDVQKMDAKSESKRK